jgi:ABC-type nitrate/sulfonate/bicarbonate transport system substrate-binding protein
VPNASGTSVRVAYVPGFVSNGAVAIGQDMGLFASVGSTVDLKEFPTGLAVSQALLTGATDVAVVPYATFFALNGQGRDVEVLANLSTNLSQQVVVGKNSGIDPADPKSFLDKKVGAIGGFVDGVYRSVYTQFGQSAASAKVVQFQSFDALTAAMKRGQIDATVTNGGAVQALIANGGGTVAFQCSAAQAPFDFCSAPNTALVASKAWVDKHETAALALVQGMIKTAQAAQADPNSVLKAAAAVEKPTDVASFNTQNLTAVKAYSANLTQAGYQKVLDEAIASKQVEKVNGDYGSLVWAEGKALWQNEK